MLCRHHHKYKRIYLNHWLNKQVYSLQKQYTWTIDLINKYIHYKNNVLSTFSWLEPVLTPALDIGIAKSGSNLATVTQAILSVKARKSFHGVLPCLVMMYHQAYLDHESFSISENLVETIVALTLNIAKLYFWMILWLMMMHYHTKFDRSEILSGQTFTEVQNRHCDTDLEYSKATFSQDIPAYACTVKLSWSPQKISSS